MVMGVVVAMMTVGFWPVPVRMLMLGMSRGGGQGVVHVRSCPSPNEIESMVEHACSGQSFEIFLHCFDASWQGDYQGVSYDSSYRTGERCERGVLQR